MNTLFENLYKFSNEVALFIEELEDNYSSPVLDEKLEYFQKRIEEYISYVPKDMGRSEKEKEPLTDTFYWIRSYCREAVNSLTQVTPDSNVFDIIDVLNSVHSSITRALPGQEFDGYDFYDSDGEIEARRITKELTTPYVDEWD